MKRISIVFAETDDEPLGEKAGQGFQVFIEGISAEDQRRLAATPQEQWTAAEFWALKSWAIVMNVLRNTGVAVSEGKAD